MITEEDKIYIRLKYNIDVDGTSINAHPIPLSMFKEIYEIYLKEVFIGNYELHQHTYVFRKVLVEYLLRHGIENNA